MKKLTLFNKKTFKLYAGSGTSTGGTICNVITTIKINNEKSKNKRSFLKRENK